MVSTKLSHIIIQANGLKEYHVNLQSIIVQGFYLRMWVFINIELVCVF